MNRVILMGRLTEDPKKGENHARYTLAVDRYGDGTDFISCVTFGKAAEFASNYLFKGTKILVEGRIQTGSYTKPDGNKVYTTDVVVERHEFCEKRAEGAPVNAPVAPVEIPDGIQEELPFK